MEIRKEATFFVVFNKPMIKITIHSTTSNRAVACSSRIPPTFLNTGPQIRPTNNLDSFRHIWESLASVLKTSDSQLFRSTTEKIQSGPDAFGKSRPLEK